MLRVLIIVSLVVAIPVPGQAAPSNENDAKSLEEAAKKVAAKIADMLTNVTTDQRRIWVRAFEAPDGYNVGISSLIAEELSKVHNFKLAKGSETAIQVSGTLTRIPLDKEAPLEGVTILTRVKLPNQKKADEFEIGVMNLAQSIPIALPTAVILSPPGQESPVKTEPTVIGGTEVRPAAESPYGIEILVESPKGTIEFKSGDGTQTYKYAVREISIDDKRPKINLNKGEKYAVRVHNRTSHDALVGIQIDGLSSFALSESDAARTWRGYFLGAGKSGIIRGYYKNSEKSYAFLVGGYESSIVAERIPDAPDVGTIAASFSAAWTDDANKPSDEPPSQVSGAPKATHKGPELADKTQTMQSFSGIPRALIKVQY